MSERTPSGGRSQKRPLVTAGIALIVGLLALLLWQSGSPGIVQAPVVPTTAAVDAEGADSASPSEAGQESEPAQAPAPETAMQVSDLPPIAYAQLPPEAHDTIDLIDQGGPFPYNKDGSTFQNREGILPDRPMGYYAEYTVDTPGSSNRGARRIVAGEDGEMYYTDDHYDSFKEIIR